MKAAALTIASLALVLTGVAGCGDDGPPTDASTADFCADFESFGEDLDALGDDPDAADVLTSFKASADDMLDTGTPEDIPDDAREGWEITMDAIQDLDDDASLEDLEGVDSDFSESEQKKSDAFDEYLGETCDLG